MEYWGRGLEGSYHTNVSLRSNNDHCHWMSLMVLDADDPVHAAS